MKTLRTVLLATGLLCVAFAAAAAHPFTVDELLRLPRIAEPQLRPDGGAVVYTVATPDIATNTVTSNLWIVTLPDGSPRQLTYSGRDRAARWSPDGRRIAFLSRRQASTAQLYLLDLAGGEPRALTAFPGDVDVPRWLPDGSGLVVASLVAPDCSDAACTAAAVAARAADNSVRVYDSGPPWSAMRWRDALRGHLFLVRVEGSAAPSDLTPGVDLDVPPRQTMDGSAETDALVVSPDGREICFVSTVAPTADRQRAFRLFTVPVEGGAPRRLTSGNGNERDPVYSPDGRYLAYRTNPEPRNGGERLRIRLLDRRTGQTRELVTGMDRSPGNLVWAADSRSLYFTAESETQQPLYALSVSGAGPARRIAEGSVADVSAAGPHTLVFTRSSVGAPAEVFTLDTSRTATPRQLTQVGKALLAGVHLSSPQSFWFKSTDGAAVQALYLPPSRPPATRHPLVVLLHGGPHTMWGDSWGYRWNPQVFAAQGYGVLMINRRGSTGYGQGFSDAIVRDWGGQAPADILAGIDAALARDPALDPSRIAAAGASYGGYMANWLATHTDRFRAIVSHAGVYDTTSMYATDIPWFMEYEFGGLPWDSESFARNSPATYASALGRYRTPMLVTTGERDFRVPFTQSIQLFAALQRQQVPSRLVVFPGEGHWIQKPQNAKQWYELTLAWLAQYLPP